MTRLSYSIIFVFFFACQAPQSKESTESINLELEVSDSVRVSYVGVLSFMDIRPEIDRALFFDMQRRAFVTTDFEGNILGEFVKDRDSPDGFGSFPMAAGRLLEGDRIQVVSMFGVFEYDFEGNLIKAAKTPKEEMKSFSGRMDALREIYPVKDKLLMTGLVARGEYNKTQPEFYDNFQQLVWIDPKTGSMEQFLHLDSASIFQNGQSHEPGMLSATFEVIDDQLYVITGGDPFLTIYELEEPYQKIKRVALDLTDFQVNEGEDPQKADPRAISFDPSYGIISKMVRVGDLLVVSYTTGYDDLDRAEYQSVNSQQAYRDFNARIAGKYKNRIQIMNLEGEKLTDFEFPEKLGNVFVSRDGALWFNALPNPEVEEDFFQLYRVEIKEAVS
ncbi:hypothetical protein SAMN04488104_10696 [Algoriphagus faecimaris]|uniref:TolB-like 6-blade propeller-like n=1 Tax=Algoriphagus faecimaris TaxID=686796 RepID=A0A1G6XW75_9BACT|nr:hypothetical protein [Algoriphagus faecimaris]SDD81913.1 hypothetical protein SAMN04488104_10696 [Algoriphagus faecimaris]